MTLKHKLIIGALVAVTLAALVSAIYAWYYRPAAGAPIQQYTPAKVENAVAKIPQKEMVINHFHYYAKEEAVKALDLPASVKDNPNVQVISDAEIPAYKGKTSAVTVIDTESGKAETIIKQKPLPLLGFENDKEIGVRYGASTQGMGGEVFGRWTFLRVGNFHMAGYGEVSAHNKTDAKAELEVSYRW